jgi:hypothetical protein
MGVGRITRKFRVHSHLDLFRSLHCLRRDQRGHCSTSRTRPHPKILASLRGWHQLQQRACASRQTAFTSLVRAAESIGGPLEPSGRGRGETQAAKRHTPTLTHEHIHTEKKAHKHNTKTRSARALPSESSHMSCRALFLYGQLMSSQGARCARVIKPDFTAHI